MEYSLVSFLVTEDCIPEDLLELGILDNICFQVTGKKLILGNFRHEIEQTLGEIRIREGSNFLYLILHEIGHFLAATEEEREDPNLMLDFLPIETLQRRESVAFYFENMVAWCVQGLDFQDVYNIQFHYHHDRQVVQPYACIYSQIEDQDVIKVSEGVKRFLEVNPKLFQSYKEKCEIISKESAEIRSVATHY